MRNPTITAEIAAQKRLISGPHIVHVVITLSVALKFDDVDLTTRNVLNVRSLSRHSDPLRIDQRLVPTDVSVSGDSFKSRRQAGSSWIMPTIAMLGSARYRLAWCIVRQGNRILIP